MTFIIVIHVLVCVLLIASVLLQPGNKGGMGAAFGGGGGGGVFGGRGANTFLAKLTAGAAVIFMFTSFSLVYFSSQSGSVFDNLSDEKPAVEPEAADEDTEKATETTANPDKAANAEPEAKSAGEPSSEKPVDPAATNAAPANAAPANAAPANAAPATGAKAPAPEASGNAPAAATDDGKAPAQ